MVGRPIHARTQYPVRCNSPGCLERLDKATRCEIYLRGGNFCLAFSHELLCGQHETHSDISIHGSALLLSTFMQSHVHNDHIHRSGSTGSQGRTSRHPSRSSDSNVDHDHENESLSSKRHGQGQGRNFSKGSHAQQPEVNYGRGSFKFGEDQSKSGMGDGIVNQNMREDLSS